MSCKEHVDALTELALGGEADARLRAHLAECAACRAEQERLARLASAMDRGLTTMMNAEPSPGFAARVRQRVAEESVRRGAWWRGWVPALAGGLAVATLAAWLAWPRITHAPDDGSPSPTAVSVPTPANPADPAPVNETPVRPGVQPAVKQFAKGHLHSTLIARSTKPAVLPEVLIAGDEWRQVAKLYALAQRGGVNSQQLAPPELTPLEGTVQALAIARLEGQPIAIQPLVENTPGAQRQ